MRTGTLKKVVVICYYLAILAGLYVIRLHSYLLFHSVVELFSVSVAFAIFMVAWNSRRFMQNDYLLFLGIAYLFVGGLDLIHLLAYEGMGVFRGYRGANLPTQLWISARYVQSVSLVAAPLFLKRRLRLNVIIPAYASLFFVLILSIFFLGVFPACFVEQTGLTTFKKVSEFVIIGILLVSLVLLLRQRDRFDPKVLRFISWSIGLTMISEFLFTLYAGPYEAVNMMGHFLKLISFYFIYKALIEIGLKEPYNLLFRDLKQREQELQAARDELETRVRQRTAQLAESEERFRMMAETIPDVFWMSTPGFEKMLYVSPAYEKIWGRSLTSVYESPRSFIDAVHPDDRDRVVAALDDYVRGFWNLQYRITQPDGSIRWIRDRGFPICDEQGDVYLMTGVTTDVTRLKTAENMLLDSSRKIEAFFKHAITPLVFLDKEFNYIRVNEAYAKACQRNIADFAGHNHFELYPHEANQRIFEHVVRTQTPYQAFATPFSFPDHPEWGLTYWDWTLVPILDDAGEVEFLVFSLKDVTERVQAELALRQKDQYLRAIVSNAPIILFATDARGTITISEGKGLEALGCRPGKSVGMNVFERYRDYPKIIENIRRALKGESFAQEVEVREGVIFDTRYSPIRDESNNVSGVIGTSVDVTERKRAERRVLADQNQLRALTAELLMVEERERRKIAGELHDSIGQILAFLKIELGDLQRAGLSRESVNTVRHVRQQVEQAIKQTRTLTFEMSPPELYTLGLGPAVEELARRFTEARNLKCSVEDCDQPIPLSDHAKILLYRSIRELLINAAKHAQAEIVRIVIARVNDEIRITVEDDGIGFDAACLDRTAHDKPTGFGLFSIRERLTHIGGRLDIQSGSDQGTKITLSAPLEYIKPARRSTELWA
jgi:PAS domain S-box-containing protein